MFPGPLGVSLAGKALERELWRLDAGRPARLHRRPPPDGRRHAVRRRCRHGDAPGHRGPGGGRAGGAAARRGRWSISARAASRCVRRACAELAAGPGVVLLCGRYEGVDHRVIEARGFLEVSLGDFVLSGGELAAMTLIDACVRLLPGVVGDCRLAGRGELRRTACWNTPTTPGRRCGRGARCRTCCCRATTPGSAHGATSRRRRSRSPGGRI